MATKIRRSPAEWRELLSSYERSGLSQQAFCDRHGLALSTFCKWRRSLGGSVTPTAAPVFAELEVAPAAAMSDGMPVEPIEPPTGHGWDVELALGEGIVLRIRRRC